MEKPSNLLLKLSRRLFTSLEQQQKFIDSLIHPQSFNPAILWCQNKPDILPFTVETPTKWQPDFVERLLLGEKPGKHPLHEQGYFYCLDFSSVFAAAVLLTIPRPVGLVFDMCASPGGKSIFAWRALQPQLLICNEVIGKRLGMLISNLKRCQVSPCAVVNRDSSIFAETMPLSSDLVIVDAPCTGQSLLAKAEKAPGCFHPTAINRSANRQKRIIANSAQLVAPQGYLVYMTCTYSPEENEEVCEWFLSKFPQFQPIQVNYLHQYQSKLTDIPCYRIFPQDELGAGAFTVLFQNTQEGKGQDVDVNALSGLWMNKVLQK
ncbi:RsmB/NOP family class I SAM-dependent RNA methyltransferase [Umezakia ovalisporum]|jgi:16S rRNA C967 or C1407 C5-methylase (RsmB/RsmF family)|uniref:RsmB/NOP family class I SAM-dependent RNA methyltransferase n=2 Tax=Umezakia ovalisporum TaxID=75695 RepID=A0AA43GWZ9_9CYAN|nr:RsmB/NOP family class I SAM-dependent RNA methyltransferase [Umezakia ovalisporum]MBI1242046.1 RsmB/NOP family class I SAM-dependent RNA methyltransferase [Nostoc sp. RI_552]MDH6056655.1 RsmB/NOP family class I SAM-dependent RNA methyltransferase [Umezakia ovalisporum FSS-43]MDH6062963.1 RsmB/NOP family class I SAM-dependent RNA methyltransferase [Umezakia ovalisporum FSS-62]MDH6067319.1 RsmB/NOP family class I SAM-dependent RNA methyltransferase [Umezakia ovalisporum APH033B]MDH6070163.1 R